VKTGQITLSVVQVNYAFDNELTDPDAPLGRHTTLTDWAEALADADARQSRLWDCAAGCGSSEQWCTRGIHRPHARDPSTRRIACEPAERRRIIDHFDWHDSWIAVGRRALEIYPT